MRTKPPRHSRVNLTLEGKDYLRRARLESSPDGETWGMLRQGDRVFDIAAGGPRARRSYLRYPQSAARYLRVTLEKGADGKGPIGITAAEVGLEERPPDPAGARGTIQLALVGEPLSKDGETITELAALPPNVPFDRLVLATAPGEFVRRIAVQGTTQRHRQDLEERLLVALNVLGNDAAAVRHQGTPGAAGGADVLAELPQHLVGHRLRGLDPTDPAASLR